MLHGTERVIIETSSVVRIDITSDSDNKNDESIDEDLFVGDKSLFNQEQTMKDLEKLTTMRHVTDERTQPSQVPFNGFSVLSSYDFVT